MFGEYVSRTKCTFGSVEQNPDLPMIFEEVVSTGYILQIAFQPHISIQCKRIAFPIDFEAQA